jgi:hypothetical protein
MSKLVNPQSLCWRGAPRKSRPSMARSWLMGQNLGSTRRSRAPCATSCASWTAPPRSRRRRRTDARYIGVTGYRNATGGDAVLVGGAATAIYTGGLFPSGDFDIVAAWDEEFDKAMLSHGFRAEDRSGHLRIGYYHPDHPGYGRAQCLSFPRRGRQLPFWPSHAVVIVRWTWGVAVVPAKARRAMASVRKIAPARRHRLRGPVVRSALHLPQLSVSCLDPDQQIG